MGLVPAVTTNIAKPDSGDVADTDRLLNVLVRFYDRFVELAQNILPSQAPALKAMVMANLTAMRQTVGAADGELGPRACFLVGASTVLDGGQALYVWNSTDKRADNGTSVIQPALTGQNAGRWNRLTSLAGFILGSGRLLRAPQILTAGTTITHPTGTTSIYVVGVGGGGAGGGTNAAAGSIGGSGGSGTYGEKTFAATAASSTYAIGAAGAGSSGSPGGAGGVTTFTHGATTMTLPGGGGGAVLTGGVTVATAASGAGGAAATNADLSINGQDGSQGVRPTAATTPVFQCGPGGSNPYGFGGAARAAAGGAVTAGAAMGFGAGGGGAVNGTGVTATAGANGGPGLLIVWEYS